MRYLLGLLLTPILFGAPAQDSPEKEIYLTSARMKDRVIERKFDDVPRKVRESRAKGTYRVKVSVDGQGNVVRARIISGPKGPRTDYVLKSVRIWKFRPLIINNRNAPFVGTIEVPFCNGAFDSPPGVPC
jgi:TonB family protein